LCREEEIKKLENALVKKEKKLLYTYEALKRTENRNDGMEMNGMFSSMVDEAANEEEKLKDQGTRTEEAFGLKPVDEDGMRSMLQNCVRSMKVTVSAALEDSVMPATNTGLDAMDDGVVSLKESGSYALEDSVRSMKETGSDVVDDGLMPMKENSSGPAADRSIRPKHQPRPDSMAHIHGLKQVIKLDGSSNVETRSAAETRVKSKQVSRICGVPNKEGNSVEQAVECAVNSSAVRNGELLEPMPAPGSTTGVLGSQLVIGDGIASVEDADKAEMDGVTSKPFEQNQKANNANNKLMISGNKRAVSIMLINRLIHPFFDE
jgi:hypothetical protein